jgi:subtilisin
MFHALRVQTLAVLLCSLAVVLMSVPATASAQTAGGTVEHVIVVLRDGVDARAAASAHANAYGLNVTHIYEHALRGYAATVPLQRLGALSRDPRVLFISEDRPVWAFQTVPTGVERIQADQPNATFGSDWSSAPIAVAVIDTGIDIDHPDLNVDPVQGTNCSSGASFNDGNGHGTHVAGTIGARGVGVVGVAPNVKLHAVRVLNNAGFGSWSSVICGIEWVTANAAALDIKVANMSLGGSGSDDGNCGNSNNDALHKAICGSVAAGIAYAVAAGNSSADFKGFVPAAYDEVVTVTAMADFNGQPGGGAPATCRSDVDDTASDFSNFAVGASNAAHTIAAPGVCILSTWKGGSYNTISGTSMASPHVAGAVTRCKATGGCTGTATAIVEALASHAIGDSTYGFTGDPSSATTICNPKKGCATLYYGYLVYGDF